MDNSKNTIREGRAKKNRPSESPVFVPFPLFNDNSDSEHVFEEEDKHSLHLTGKKLRQKNQKIKACFVGDIIIIPDNDDCLWLLRQGFFGKGLWSRGNKESLNYLNIEHETNLDGDKNDEKTLIMYEEAFFLQYALGCLDISQGDNDLSSLSLWNILIEKKPTFWATYSAYHFYRCKGYVVKPGLKFATDFILYEDGPMHFHSSFCILVRPKYKDEMSTFSWEEVSNLQRLSESVVKNFVICFVSSPNIILSTAQEHISMSVLQNVEMSEQLVQRFLPGKYKQPPQSNRKTNS